jgi:hypothetical protein
VNAFPSSLSTGEYFSFSLCLIVVPVVPCPVWHRDGLYCDLFDVGLIKIGCLYLQSVWSYPVYLLISQGPLCGRNLWQINTNFVATRSLITVISRRWKGQRVFTVCQVKSRGRDFRVPYTQSYCGDEYTFPFWLIYHYHFHTGTQSKVQDWRVDKLWRPGQQGFGFVAWDWLYKGILRGWKRSAYCRTVCSIVTKR